MAHQRRRATGTGFTGLTASAFNIALRALGAPTSNGVDYTGRRRGEGPADFLKRSGQATPERIARAFGTEPGVRARREFRRSTFAGDPAARRRSRQINRRYGV